MKKKLIALMTAGVLAISCISASAQSDESFHRSLTVSGSATVTAKSDTATIHLSVETSSPNVKAAVRENANTMTAVRNAVISAGADASKIETQNYQVYPQNTYDDKGRVKNKTYNCTNSMNVVVSRLDKTGEVMDAAVQAGANRIDSVDFSVSNTQVYKDQALREATADALRKANIMAAALGRNVINVISVSEDSNNVVPYRMMKVNLAAARSNDEGAPTPLAPGDAKMESHVTVVFEIG